jgi:hypothetical protein
MDENWEFFRIDIRSGNHTFISYIIQFFGWVHREFHEKIGFQVNFMFNNNKSINNKRIFKGNYVITIMALMSHLVLISVSNAMCIKT